MLVSFYSIIDSAYALFGSALSIAELVLSHSGHDLPKIENRTEFTENRTEFTETEKFGSRFGSEISGTEFTEVFSVPYLGKPKVPNNTEFT